MFNQAFRIAYRLSVPLMFLWVFAGYWFQGFSSPLTVAMYTALDRPVFVGLTAVAMLGFFNKIDGERLKLLSTLRKVAGRQWMKLAGN